jgi:hypothetical protein
VDDTAVLSQMALTLYVGNAMKDLVSAPRPLGVKYGRERLKLLGNSKGEKIYAQVSLSALLWCFLCFLPGRGPIEVG